MNKRMVGVGKEKATVDDVYQKSAAMSKSGD